MEIVRIAMAGGRSEAFGTNISFASETWVF
jgi:hypothetical protein